MILTPKQEKYIEILSRTFNIKDSYGKIMPYRPLEYQIKYHTESMLCKDDFKHRIWSKSRGVGATLCSCMDLLMLAHRYDNSNIAISSRSAESATTPIDYCIWLANHTQINGFFDIDNKYSSICRLGNGSVIFPVPGGAPDSVRGVRLIAVLLDELAFTEQDKEIYVAVDGSISEGGQLSIVSTWNGFATEHSRVWKQAEEIGYEKFEVRAFSDNFDVNKPIQAQLDAGVKLNVPWLDIIKMERSRVYDRISFLQEYMCQPSDINVAFLDWELINSCSREGLEQTKRDGINPYYFGLDFATEDSDFSVMVVFELTPEFGAVMRHIRKFRKMDSVAQYDHMIWLDSQFNFSKIGIDQTGPGKGIYDFCRKRFGSKVLGFNFATKVRPIGEHGEKLDAMQKRQEQWKKATVPIKRAMASAMRSAMIDQKCWFISDPDLKGDLNSVPYGSLDAPKSKMGHGDSFWSCAITLYMIGMPIGSDPVIFENILPSKLETVVLVEDDSVESRLRYAQKQVDDMNVL